MAHESFTSFTDTTEQTVFGDQCYIKGIFVVNPGLVETDGWVSLWNLANPTPGTTSPDIVLFCPFSNPSGKGSYRVTFSRTLFDIACTVFFSDTAAVNASAWNAGSGFKIDVYFERFDS